MQPVALKNRTGFSRRQSLAMNGQRLIGHRAAHEVGQRDDHHLRTGGRPFFQALVGGGPCGGARHLRRSDDAGVRRRGGVGNVPEHQRAKDGIQKFQAPFETLQSFRIVGALAVTKPKRKIHADDERGPELEGLFDFHLARRFGLKKEQRVGKIFHRLVRHFHRGVQVRTQPALQRVRAAERLGEGEARRRARAHHDDSRPRGRCGWRGLNQSVGFAARAQARDGQQECGKNFFGNPAQTLHVNHING